MRARTTLGIIALMVLANTVLGVDILVSALLAALLVLLARCVHVSDLRRSVDLRLIVVIACSFALGAALDKTGVAAVAADFLQGWEGAAPFLTMVARKSVVMGKRAGVRVYMGGGRRVQKKKN